MLGDVTIVTFAKVENQGSTYMSLRSDINNYLRYKRLSPELRWSVAIGFRAVLNYEYKS